MPKFTYNAYAIADPSERVTGAQIEATSQQEAIQLIQQNGYQPIEIRESAGGLDLPAVRALRNRVKPQQLAFVTRQMATMIGAGMSPIETLQVLEGATTNNRLKLALADVREGINQGKTPSEAMEQYPEIFNITYTNLVRAGEVGGDLPTSLFRLADSLDKDAQFKREVKSAMFYPVGVLIFASLIVIAMLMFVVPAFEGMFKELDSELPKPTQMLVSASAFLKSPIGIVTLFVAPPSAAFLFRKWIGTQSGRYAWDRFKLKVKPKAISNLVTMIVTARFVRSMATLYGAGIPVIRTLEIAGPTSGNAVVNERVEDATESIKQGATIAAALREHEVLPDMASAMLVAGEKSGDVSGMMEKVAEVYEEEVAAAVKGLKAIIEPLLMVVIGGIVGTVVVSLYMPMFSIYDKIG